MIEKIFLAATLIEGVAGARDGVEGGGECLAVRFPGAITFAESGSAHLSIGVGHKGASLGHGQSFFAPIGPDHLEMHFPGEVVVEATPGTDAIDS